LTATRRQLLVLLVGLLALFAARAAPAVAGTDAGTRTGAGNGNGNGNGNGELISFGVSTCAPGWRAPNPGRASFRLHNDSSTAATVYLFVANSGRIVATASDVRANSTKPLTVKLKPGVFYAWGCDLNGYPRHVSDAQAVPRFSSVGGPGPVVIPITAGQLVGPLLAYRSYVTKLLATVQAQLASTAAAIASGSLTASQSDWLAAHLTWLEIGQDDGAYGAFGELGGEIDGTAAGLVGGTASPNFTGFHKIELDLWQQQSLSAAATDTAHLQSLVAKLAATKLADYLPTSISGLTNFTLRCHEILEDALRDTLTGDDDYGSGTGLASLTADVTATREFLTLFAPMLAGRSPYLVGTARRQLSALLTAIDATQQNGQWVGVTALPTRQRQLIDADTGAALETLSPVPDLLALGNT
jgi:high-affinity iron transporter